VQTRTMRYFFHLEDGACIRDPKGTDFLDDAAAMHEATKVAQELSKLRVHAYEWCVVVKNADGLRVGSVPLVPSAAEAHGAVASPRSIR
jgi:histidinol phosphatase-like enzyme